MKKLFILLVISLCIFGIWFLFIKKEKGGDLILEYNLDDCIFNSDPESKYMMCCGKNRNLENCMDKTISRGDIIVLSVNITDDYEKNMLEYPIECHYTDIEPNKESSGKTVEMNGKKFYLICGNVYNFFNNNKQLYTFFIGKTNKDQFLFRILLAPEGVNEDNLVENIGSCIEIFFIERWYDW